MKNFNPNQLHGEKILREIDNYVKDLLNQNERLKEELNNFNKDDEIQKLKQELSDVRTNSLMIMSKKEKRDAKSFSEEHYQSCKSNIIYILEGTGIGTAITVKCKKCNTHKGITDAENW